MTRVKICGIKTVDQARCAIQSGADFLGFIFYPPSHRYVEPAAVGQIVSDCRASLPSATWAAVGVFVDEPLHQLNETLRVARLDYAQLCGAETAEYASGVARPVIRVVHVSEDGICLAATEPAAHGAARIMLDTARPGHYGGTGQVYPWARVRDVSAEAFLAGGLSPDNVATAIEVAHPWAVDVSSGVERDMVKDPVLIAEFISEVRRVDQRLSNNPD
ncbi:MAG: phosphoribosylanthranilate isomerase [Chloroflexota bacterium]